MLQQDFSDNIFYRIMNFSYWFLLCNVYFFLFSLPALILLQFQWDTRNLFFWVILLVSLLPIGPALTASFGSMGKLAREKHVSVTKEFFGSLRLNFKQSLLLWTLQLSGAGILMADIYFLSDIEHGSLILPLLYLLLILNLVSGLYLYPLLSRFVMPNKSLLKMSFGFALFKIKMTLLLLLLIGISGLLFIYLPFMSIFFLIGPFCFLAMIILKGLFDELEQKVK